MDFDTRVGDSDQPFVDGSLGGHERDAVLAWCFFVCLGVFQVDLNAGGIGFFVLEKQRIAGGGVVHDPGGFLVDGRGQDRRVIQLQWDFLPTGSKKFNGDHGPHDHDLFFDGGRVFCGYENHIDGR